METIIFIVIAAIITIIQNRAEKAKKKSQQQPPPWRNRRDESSSVPDDNDGNEDTDEAQTPPKPFAARKLQEYIRQFEEAQREASQGTMESPMPPPIPENYHRLGDQVTMREVAEDIVEQGLVDIDYLKIEFEVSEARAIELINELQQHRIIGHDMGDGAYEVLVQDIDELNNLLSHEQKAEALAQTTTSTVKPSASPNSSDKQSQLKILEERARKAREEANEAARQSDIENGYASETVDGSEQERRRTVRSISRESVRRGFIWGKIIDEPRFKKRWSPAQR